MGRNFDRGLEDRNEKTGKDERRAEGKNGLTTSLQKKQK